MTPREEFEAWHLKATNSSLLSCQHQFAEWCAWQAAYKAGAESMRANLAIAVAALNGAVGDVAKERMRQQEKEGWSAAHDDNEHDDGTSLARAAIGYASHYVERGWTHAINPTAYQNEDVNDAWPWDRAAWKPKDPRRDLVRAAALLCAEIDRLDRAAARDALAKIGASQPGEAGGKVGE